MYCADCDLKPEEYAEVVFEKRVKTSVPSPTYQHSVTNTTHK